MSLNVFFVLFRLLCPENQDQVRCVAVSAVGMLDVAAVFRMVVMLSTGDRGNKLKLAATEKSWRPPGTQLLM